MAPDDQETAKSHRSGAVEKSAGKKKAGRGARKRTGSPSRSRAKSAQAPTRMQNTVAQDLEHLRTLLGIVTARFADNLDGEIAQIRETALTCPRSRKRQTTLVAMHKMVEELTLKPEKGRSKDLKRLDKLVAQLNKLARKF